MCVYVSAETLTESSLPESAALVQFNKSWAELSDWLALLDNMMHNKRVVVADLDDINDNIGRLKVFIALNYILSKTSTGGTCSDEGWVKHWSAESLQGIVKAK